jgi:cytochrome b561
MNAAAVFGSVARALHWGMALLILVSLAMIDHRDNTLARMW